MMTLDDLTRTSYTRVTLSSITLGATCLYATISEPTMRDALATTIRMLPAFCVGAYVGARLTRQKVERYSDQSKQNQT